MQKNDIVQSSTSFLLMHRSILILTSASLLLAACTGNSGESVSLSDTHIHGLAVDRGNSNAVYIATHHGTLLLQDGNLTLIGDKKDDYMGFSPHPTDPNIFFSSGHPSGGGNLGVQKSMDGGKTWTKLSDGDPSGPVDFHAMTVHEKNPDLIVGWYRDRLYRSENGGTTWSTLSASTPPIITLGSDPQNERVLYAGTEHGLLKSIDRGETWENVPSFTDTVIDIEADPAHGGLLLATPNGIVRMSPDAEGGITFAPVGALPAEAVPMQIALDRKNPQVLYATSERTVYKSGDGGKTWQKML